MGRIVFYTTCIPLKEGFKIADVIVERDSDDRAARSNAGPIAAIVVIALLILGALMIWPTIIGTANNAANSGTNTTTNTSTGTGTTNTNTGTGTTNNTTTP